MWGLRSFLEKHKGEEPIFICEVGCTACSCHPGYDTRMLQLFLNVIFSVPRSLCRRGSKQKTCSQRQAWKWVAIYLLLVFLVEVLWQICAPRRALEAANTLTCSVSNEQIPHRMSCHMIAQDMILAVTWWKQLAKRPETFNSASMELLESISHLSLTEVKAESESKYGFFKWWRLDTSKSWHSHSDVLLGYNIPSFLCLRGHKSCQRDFQFHHP